MIRRPRSLYSKIFLWFCLTAVVATTLVLSVAGITGSQPFGRRWMAMTQDLYAHSAVDFYSTGGAPALAGYLAVIDRGSAIEGHLLNVDGVDVLGGSFPLHERSVFEQARRTGHSAGWLGRFWTAASPVTGPHGERYVFVMEAHPLRGFLDGTFFFSMVPRLLGGLALVALFCLLLARHITQPIRLLQTAATRMAAGDLSVRTLPSMPTRHDELSAMAAAFDSMTERIEELLGTQRQMLADISHELRSPLTRIGVSLELMRRGETDVLEPIQADLDRLNQMIGDILALTRLDLQARPQHMKMLDLHAVLMDIVDDANYEGRGEGKSVRLVGEGPCPVSGEEALLHSCIENIVRNALQHTPAGGMVEVNLHASDRDGVIVRIDDTGPGVPADVLPSIFTPFFRGPGSAAVHPHGSGMGLSISARIAQRHGGRVTAENRTPHGLRVALQLPGRV